MPSDLKQYKLAKLYGIVHGTDRDFITLEKVKNGKTLGEAYQDSSNLGNDSRVISDYYTNARTAFINIIDDHFPDEIKKLGLLQDHNIRGSNTLFVTEQNSIPPFGLYVIDPVGFGKKRVVKSIKDKYITRC